LNPDSSSRYFFSTTGIANCQPELFTIRAPRFVFRVFRNACFVRRESVLKISSPFMLLFHEPGEHRTSNIEHPTSNIQLFTLHPPERQAPEKEEMDSPVRVR
jgi:hypothetical protein